MYALNRIATVTNNNGTTTYGYFKDSRLRQVQYPNAIAAHYQYDRAGRVKAIENRQNGGPVSRYDYLYDGNGNRVQQTEVNGGTGETTRYVYDDFDRLEKVQNGVHGCPSDPAILCSLSTANRSVSYTYDDAFNRTGEQHVDGTGTTILDRTYIINTCNQIDNIVDNLNTALNIAYTYDANGNQLSKIQSGDVTEYVWGNRDHLRKVVQDGANVGQFRYSAHVSA